MDLEKVNSLKEKGNKAYVDGKYDIAIGHYKEALDSVGLEDTNTAAILHLNISQAYLKKKDYSLAAENVTELLKLDPSFKKPDLRRASVNVELDNITDSMNDLRLIFVSEPNSKAAKDLMRRCFDKPKMKLELHMIYAKHYMRQILKKLGAQVMDQRDQATEKFTTGAQNAVLRQSFLSMESLDVANYFFFDAFVGFGPRGNVFINFFGWIPLQFMWLNYACIPVVVVLSDNLFNLLYQLLRSGTFSLAIVDQFSICDKTLLLNKHLDVFLFKELLLSEAPVDMNDLKLMDHYSEYMTRLVYHPGLANLKNKKFSKATILAFDPIHSITSDFLKSWKNNEWPIESLFFTHGAPDLQALKQLKQSDGVIPSKVKNVVVQFEKDNQRFNKVTYNKLCDNLAILKSGFPGLEDVTIVQRYHFKIQGFSTFVQGFALIHEAYKTISTKPEWCPKLKAIVFVSFTVNSPTDAKIFNVKLLGQSVKSLRQKHPNMKIRLCGPRSYNGFYSPILAVPAVIEFENDVAQFELAVCYDYPLY